MDDFNRKRHAVYKLTYHAVFVIKYRRNVMSEPIIDQMRTNTIESIKPRDTPTRVLANGRGSITVPDHRHDPSPSQRLCVAFCAIFQETDSLPSAIHPKTFCVLL